MGNGIIGFYNNRIKKEWKTAFYASLVISMLTHIYKFTNTLPNHDALYNIYCDQNMIGLGRWLLAPACMFSSFFDLPWLTGLLAIFLILLVFSLLMLFQSRLTMQIYGTAYSYKLNQGLLYVYKLVLFYFWAQGILQILGSFGSGFLQLIAAVCEGAACIILALLFGSYAKEMGRPSKETVHAFYKNLLTPTGRLALKEQALSGASYSAPGGQNVSSGARERSFSGSEDHSLEVKTLKLFDAGNADLPDRFELLGETSFSGDEGDPARIMKVAVLKDSLSNRKLLRLTGLDVQENQARRLLNDLDA